MEYQRLRDFFTKQQEDFIRLVSRMVSFETYSGEKEKINLFLNSLQKLFSGFQPELERIPTPKGDILSLSFFPGYDEFAVLLGHVDTVKVTDSSPSAKVIGQTMYGNGCCDMKSGLALYYFVLKAIWNLKLEMKKGLRLIFTPDEETGSEASLPYLLKECKDSKGVILLEPSCPDGGAKTRRKGIVYINAKLKGKAAHSGIEPEKGRDANRALAELLILIDQITSDYPDVSFNPGIISGGTLVNVVSPHSHLKGEFRSFSNNHLKDVMKRVWDFKDINGVEVDVHAEMVKPALEFDNKNRAIFSIAEKIAEGLGKPLKEGCTGGGSDGSNLSAAGVPVIDGLGMKGGGSHSQKEFIDLTDFPFRAALTTALCVEL